MPSKKKDFDCLEMKRAIQERIYRDTCAMKPDEYRAYIRQRIAMSQFASFLNESATTGKAPR